MTAPKRKTLHYSGTDPVRPPAGSEVNGEPVDSIGIVSAGDSVRVDEAVADSLLDRDEWKTKAAPKTKTKESPKAAGAGDKMAEPDAADSPEED